MGKFTKNAVGGKAFSNINEALSEFGNDGGGALASRFEVVLHPPAGMRKLGGGGSPNVYSQQMGEMQGDGSVRKTSLRISQIGFPARTLDTTPDNNIYGPIRNIATGYSYGTLASVIQCSTNMVEKNFIDTWQRLAYDPQTWSMGYYNDYVGSMDIYLLDRDETKKYGVQLVECYPSSMGEQGLDYTQAGSVMTLSVTWTYRYWKNLTDEADLPKPVQDNTAEIKSRSSSSKYIKTGLATGFIDR
jgi:hypothetical protein